MADTEQKRRDLRSSRCLGSAAGRLLSRTCNDPEAVVRSCMERREDLARRGWRAEEGGGDEESRDPFGQVREFEEELEEGTGSEDEVGSRVVAQEGGTRIGEEALDGEGGGAAATPAAAAASGSASAAAQRQSARPVGSGTGCSSSEEDMGEHSRHELRIGGGLPAATPERRLTTKPWRRDPDWLYPSFIGVAAREAAAAEATARASAAAVVQGPPVGFAGAGDFPELPEAEAQAVMAQLGMKSVDLTGGEDEASESTAPHLRGGGCGATHLQADTRSGTAWIGAKRAAAGSGSVEKRRRTDDDLAPGRLGAPAAAAINLVLDWPGLDEPSEDDPFGHVADDLAAQPSPRGRRQVAELEDDVNRAGDRRGELRRAAQDGQGGDDEMRSESADTQEGRGRDHRHSPEDGVRHRMDERDHTSTTGRKRSLAEWRPEDGPERKRQRHPFGRRYLGVKSDPVDAANARGHSLRITGPVIWCNLCGRYATRRLGKALKSDCSGTAGPAYVTRLARLRDGRHPLTGKFIL